MSDQHNPYQPQQPSFPWNEESDAQTRPLEPHTDLTPPPYPPAGSQPFDYPGASASQTDSAQPSYAQPGYPQMPYPQAGYAPSSYPQPDYGQQGYPQPSYPPQASYPQLGYGYAPGSFAAGPVEPAPGMTIAALTLSIIGAVLSFLPFSALLGVPLLALAVIFAIIALSKYTHHRGMSIASLIVSGISGAWGILMLFATLGAFLSF